MQSPEFDMKAQQTRKEKVKYDKKAPQDARQTCENWTPARNIDCSQSPIFPCEWIP